MRNPGEWSADRGADHRIGQGSRDRVLSGQPSGAGPQPGLGGSSLFAPGYSGDQPTAGEAAFRAAACPGGGWHGPAAGMAGKGPVRGYPPAPGQPPPVYPQGQFSAWNRVPRQAENGYRDTHQGTVGRAAADYPESPAADSAGPWYSEPGQALLAVGEPWTGEPSTGEPWTGEPSTGEPSTGEPSTGEPSTGEPWTGEPSTGEPSTGEPWTGEPWTGEPWTGEPGYPEPAYSVLAVSDPAADVTSTQSWAAVDASLAPGSRAAQPGSGGRQGETGRQAAPQRSPAPQRAQPGTAAQPGGAHRAPAA